MTKPTPAAFAGDGFMVVPNGFGTFTVQSLSEHQKRVLAPALEKAREKGKDTIALPMDAMLFNPFGKIRL